MKPRIALKIIAIAALSLVLALTWTTNQIWDVAWTIGILLAVGLLHWGMTRNAP